MRQDRLIQLYGTGFQESAQTKKADRKINNIAHLVDGPLTDLDDDRLYHTIQLISYVNEAPARRQFEVIAGRLKKNELPFLRVEKVGKYYALRLGRFESYHDVSGLYESLKDEIPEAAVIKGYVRGDRVVKIYRVTSASAPAAGESMLAESEKIITGKVEAEKNERKSPATEHLEGIQNLGAEQEYHTIQIVSYVNEAPAKRHYDTVAAKLNPGELGYLRIEKIGDYYTLRLGKFGDYRGAAGFLESIRKEFPDAVLKKAYIKEDRIVRMFVHPADESINVVKEREVSEPLPEILPQVEPWQPEPEKPESAKSQPNEKISTLKGTLSMIVSLVNQGEYNAAHQILKTEIEGNRSDPDLNAWYGVVLLKMDRPAEAIRYFRTATELSPDVSAYYNGLGYSLLFLNRPGQAVVAFEKVINIEPGHFDALTGLCIAHVKTGNTDKAMAIYNGLKGHEPEISEKLLEIIKKNM
ncbi:tetratricopeptide repeat protein [bacterium]|nr:tetratricopeptide repeat protein [bacterium]